MSYSLKPGWEWNPLRKYRNIQCPCGKGKKSKQCCGRHEVIPADVAKKLRKYLAAFHPKSE